jgi:aminomethyltransferase
MLKRTPLFAAHQRLGARLVEFGGWEMPVQYTGIVDEHRTVRRAAGLFDISHMGELFVRGPGALAFVNRVFTNDAARLQPGRGQYTLMCDERGGTIDDLYLYQVAPGEYLAIVNASRIEADVAWLRHQCALAPADSGAVLLEDLSERYGALALQGPAAAACLESALGAGAASTAPAWIAQLKRNRIASVPVGGNPVWVARTGYTGEDGFELIAPAESVASLWDLLLAAGRDHGLKPVGLGARDTLRTEMGYSLYGHELSQSITPVEAGLERFIAFDKGAFVGRDPLSAQRDAGVTRACVAFRTDPGAPPPRPGYPIWTAGADARPVGEVTSGTQSPSLGVGIGLGCVPPALAAPGTRIQIEVRQRRAPASVVAKPIYQKAS